MTAELDDFLLNDEPEQEGEPAGDSGEQPAPPAAAKDPGPDKQEKRIRDLMGNWQKEQARANAAEAKLREFVRSGGSPAPAPTNGKMPAEVEAWFTEAKEAAIDRIYASDPRFEAYGIDRAQLAGATPSEVRASADRVRKMIDGLESKVRNQTLLEHGFAPRLGGESSGPAKDYASMSKEEFEAEVVRARGGF